MFNKILTKKTSKIFPKNFFQRKFFTNQINQNTINFPKRPIELFLQPENFTFVDNTNFIEKILSNTKTQIFYQPENFGKNFNLELLRYFLSNNEKLENFLTVEKRENFFANKKIFTNEEIKKNFFASYPVIYLNLKELNEINFSDNFEKFKFLLNAQIAEIFNYPEHKNLNDFEFRFIEDFYSNKKNDENFIANLPKEISRLLGKITSRSPFVLVNGFDFPLMNSLGNSTFESHKEFLELLMRNTFAENQFIFKGVLCGTNDLEKDFLFSKISNLEFSFYKSTEKAMEFSMKHNNLNENFGVNLQDFSFKNQEKYLTNTKNEGNFTKNSSFSFFNQIKKIAEKDLISTYLNSTNNNYNENKENLLKKLTEELEIESILNHLNLKELFSNLVNHKSKDYLNGYKILNLLNNKSEIFIEEFLQNANNPNSNNTIPKFKTFYNKNFEIEINQNFGFDLSNPLQTESFLNFLLSNNLIQYQNNKTNSSENFYNLTIPNIQSALLISNAFKRLKFHEEDYNRNLAFLFYKYLYFNKIKDYLSEIKKIFNITNKEKNQILKPNKITFKTEKDMENYFIHIFTLELNLENSTEKINIYQIEDDEDTQISPILKDFVLITYDDRKFATFVKFNKYKIPTSQAKEELMGIEEIQNNSVIKKAANRKPMILKPEEIARNLKEVNSNVMQEAKDSEMVKFLRRISDDFEAFNVVSISNYGRFVDFEMREVSLGD